MSWFMENKGPIGSVLAALGGAFLASGTPNLVPWGQGLMTFGTGLMGSGFLKSDQYYKDKKEMNKLVDSLENNPVYVEPEK